MSRKKRQSRYERKANRGEQQIAQDIRRKQFDNDWALDWFVPTEDQEAIVESINKNVFTIVDGSTGTGKTTTALWKGLCDYREGVFNKVVFLKNPIETGDDKIGYLSGNETDKLKAHYETTKHIFDGFISKGKLDNDISNGKIQLSIPNFLLGATFDYSFVIIDESQLMTPDTTKLILERCGVGTKYVILGDSAQRYAVKRRYDGFRDLIGKVVVGGSPKYDMFGYIKMDWTANKRLDASALITRIYE